MKVLVVLTLVGGLFATQIVAAKPSQGRVVALCKMQISEVFGDKTHIRLKRIRGRKSTFAVRPSGEERRHVVCTLDAGNVLLADRSGQVLNEIATSGN